MPAAICVGCPLNGWLGLFADLYARTYPNEVAGIVFVDCPHPEEIKEQKKFKLPKVLQLANTALNLIDKWFDRYVHSEDENLTTTVAQIQRADNLPDIPISIVSGQKKMPFVPPAAFAMHQAYQQKLLDLSPHAKQYLCHNSGHFPQITEPEIVISSIVEIMADIDSNK